MPAIKIGSRPERVNEKTANKIITTGFLTILYLLFLALTPALVFAQGVKLLRGNSYEIGLTKPQASFKVPVSINAAIKGKQPVIRLINVSFQNPAKAVADSAFTVNVAIDNYNNAFLQILVNNDPALDQGKYQLLLNVFRDLQDTLPETLSIDVSIKAAALTLPISVIATRTSAFPFTGYCSSIKPLSLFETSRNTAIGPLSIREISMIDSKGTTVTGKLTFEELSKGIPSGLGATFPYQLSGNFPIGTVVGTYELNAPQLANPVPFTIQIITKRGGGWIILIIAAGLVFGFLTRIYLEARIQRDKTVLDALELLQLIREEKQNRPDEKFGEHLDRIFNDLKTSVDLRKTEDITAAVTAARAALTVQIDAIKKAQADNKTDLDNLSNFLGISWPSLPQPFSILVDQAIPDLDKAVSDNEKYKVTSAKIAFAALRKRMLGDFRIAARSYKQLSSAGLNDIKNSTFKLQGFYPVFLTKLDALLDEVDKIPSDVNDNKDDKIIGFQNLFQSVSQSRGNVLNLLFNLTSGVKTLVDGMVDMLASTGAVAPNLLTAYTNLEQKISVAGNRSPEDVLAGIRATLQVFQQDIIKALTDDQPKLDDAQKILIREDLNNGLYIEATKKVAGFVRDSNAIAGSTVVENAILPAVPAMDISFNEVITASALILNEQAQVNNDNEQVTIEKFHTRVLNKLALHTIIQTLLIGTGIALMGYTIFAEKFTGTPTDMIEVFSWSLVLDITLNSTLTGLIGKVPKKIGA